MIINKKNHSIILCFVLFFLLLNEGQAFIPSLETLLKNSYNSSPKTSQINLKFQIKELKIGQELGSNTLYANYTLFNGKSKNDQGFSQELYKESSYSKESLISKIMSINSKPKEFTNQQQLFYALLFNSYFNSSDYLINFLEKYNNNYISNRGLINKDKVELIGKYKEFLLQNKINSKQKGKLESPLSPSNYEERYKVTKLYYQNLLQTPPYSTIERENDNFFFHYRLQYSDLGYQSSNNHLLFLKHHETSEQEANRYFSFGVEKYIILNNGNSVPDTVYIESNNSLFLLKLKSIEFVNDLKGGSPLSITEISNEAKTSMAPVFPFLSL